MVPARCPARAVFTGPAGLDEAEGRASITADHVAVITGFLAPQKTVATDGGTCTTTRWTNKSYFRLAIGVAAVVRQSVAVVAHFPAQCVAVAANQGAGFTDWARPSKLDAAQVGTTVARDLVSIVTGLVAKPQAVAAYRRAGASANGTCETSFLVTVSIASIVGNIVAVVAHFSTQRVSVATNQSAGFTDRACPSKLDAAQVGTTIARDSVAIITGLVAKPQIVSANRGAGASAHGTGEAGFCVAGGVASIARDSVAVVAWFRTQRVPIAADRGAGFTQRTSPSKLDVTQVGTPIARNLVVIVTGLVTKPQPIAAHRFARPPNNPGWVCRRDTRTYESRFQGAGGRTAIPVIRVAVIAEFSDKQHAVPAGALS